MNTISFRETQTSRLLDGSFTDTAIENIAAPLNAFFGGLNVFGPRRAHSRNDRVGEDLTAPAQLSLLGAGDDFVEGSESIANATSPISTIETLGEKSNLTRIFKNEDGTLRLDDWRIKADSKAEFVTRITCLFLHAHELDNRLNVPRAAWIALLKEASVYDANARTWLKATRDVRHNSDGTLSLTLVGKERAIDTLNRYGDSNVTGKFQLGVIRARSSKQGAKASADDELTSVAKSSKRSSAVSGSSKVIASWITAWKAKDIKVNPAEVLRGRSTGEKGLFGLWAIRQALGDEGKVVSRLRLAQFLYEAFEIQIDDSSLGRALKQPEFRGKVLNTGGTKFQIPQDGIAFVDEMIAQASKSSANGKAPKKSAVTS